MTMGTVRQYFVTFLSPGTFTAEMTTKQIDVPDISAAIHMAGEITERHGAHPYGFYFTLREREEEDLDSHETERSGTYYINGKIRTLAQVKEEGNPDEPALAANMECNGWDRVVTTQSPYRWTRPIGEFDVVMKGKE